MRTCDQPATTFVATSTESRYSGLPRERVLGRHFFRDVALRAVAAALRGAARESDTLVRLGGEEFVVMQGDVWTAALERADAAMYEAKQSGRNRVILGRDPP